MRKSTGQKRRESLLSDQVAREISDKYILSGKIDPGELLPSEATLSLEFDVSRVSIRAAIRSLWDQGLISVRNGVGAVVLPRAKEIRHGLDRLASIDTSAKEMGYEVGTDNMEWNKIPADAEISVKLQIPVDAQVLQVKRQKTIGDSTVAWIIDTVPLRAVDENAIKGQFEGSILDIILANKEYSADYADTEIKPCLASDDMKASLAPEHSGLLLFMDTTVVTLEGEPLIWGQIWFDPTFFKFAFQRRRLR